MASLRRHSWWSQVEKEIRSKYGTNCNISSPVNIRVRLLSGKEITIERSWYDILVIDNSHGHLLKSKLIDAKEGGFHCIEIKFSKKEGKGSFGAFTVGEWIAASLSLKVKTFTYELYFVVQNESNVTVKRTIITQKILEEMLFYPQFKLYFQSWFIQNIFSETSSIRIRKNINPAINYIIEGLRKSLKELLDESSPS